MGTRFTATTALRVPKNLITAHKTKLPIGLEFEVRLEGIHAIPIGPPLMLVHNECMIGYCEAFKVRQSLVKTKKTTVRARVINQKTAVALARQEHHYVHNYIGWPPRDERTKTTLQEGQQFSFTKDGARHYPIGNPIQVAIGDDFQIVASCVLSHATISALETSVRGKILVVYDEATRAVLTHANRLSEQKNGR